VAELAARLNVPEDALPEREKHILLLRFPRQPHAG
jgi:hypothetical protein